MANLELTVMSNSSDNNSSASALTITPTTTAHKRKATKGLRALFSFSGDSQRGIVDVVGDDDDDDDDQSSQASDKENDKLKTSVPDTYRIWTFHSLYPILCLYGFWGAGTSHNPKRKWRWLHKFVMLGAQIGFLIGAIIVNIQRSHYINAAAEASTIFPYVVVYTFLTYYIHTQHLDKLLASVLQFTGKVKTVHIMVRIHSAVLIIISVAVVVAWQTVLFAALQVKEPLTTEDYNLFTPCGCLLFLSFSMCCQLHMVHIRHFSKSLRKQRLSLQDARHQYHSICNAVEKSCNVWKWMLSSVLVFCSLAFILWLYVAAIELQNLFYLFFAAVPLAIAFFLLACAAHVTAQLAQVKNVVNNLVGQSTFTNTSYTREEVDSFGSYVSMTSPSFAVFDISISYGRLAALGYTAGGVILLAVRALVSSQKSIGDLIG